MKISFTLSNQDIFLLCSVLLIGIVSQVTLTLTDRLLYALIAIVICTLPVYLLRYSLLRAWIERDK